MRRILHEPFVHFLLLGAAFFAVHSWRNRDADAGAAARSVRITANDVAWLTTTWARQWQRPPSELEARGLVADYLKETLLALEAETLGLAENDTIVRRRLAQKMEFLIRDTAPPGEPDEAELRAYLTAHPERFGVPARASFTQLFFDESRHEDARGEARRVLALLADPGNPADADAFGDPSLLERRFGPAEPVVVARTFGEEFAAQVFAAEPRRWTGPIESEYGVHLVRVDELSAAQAPDFPAVRDNVAAAWSADRSREHEERALAALLEKYKVVADDSVRHLLAPLREESGPRAAGEELRR